MAGDPEAAWARLIALIVPYERTSPLRSGSERYGDRILVDIKTDTEQFLHALTLHETVFLGTFIGFAGLPLAALFRLARINPRFGPAG